MISPTEILTLRSEAVKVQATTLVCCEGSECALVAITPTTSVIVMYCFLLVAITPTTSVVVMYCFLLV